RLPLHPLFPPTLPPLPPPSTLLPYTTLFRSRPRRLPYARRLSKRLARPSQRAANAPRPRLQLGQQPLPRPRDRSASHGRSAPQRSEEHTSELQSRVDLVCRLLLEKKKTTTNN